MPVIIWTDEGQQKRAYIVAGVDVAAEAARIGASNYTEYADGEAPAPEDPPVTAEQVKAEALRRIDAIADTRKRDQLIQRALRLVMKVTIEGQSLTQAEQAEIAAESVLADRIEVVQAAERALLAMDPIPADYADDKWWTP